VRVPDPLTPSRRGLLSSPHLGLYAALLAALLARVWALNAHLPFSPGVDEPEVMERAVRMMKTGDLNPHFFDYPSLYMYVEAIASTLRFLYGAVQGRWAGLAQAPTEEFYLWGRAVTALLGTATVGLLYRVGLYWNRRTALLAAAMLAVMPLHVRESHYTLTDVPSTFFVTLTLLLSLRAHERATVWAFALAGAAAGLAGATKYNAGLAVIVPLIAAMMTRAASPGRGAALAAALIGMFTAFLAAAPYSILDLPHFLNGFARLASEYRAPANTSDPVWTVYLKQLRNALQVPGSVFVLGGIALGAVRTVWGQERLKWALALVFPLLYFYFVAHQNIVFARYLLPLVPSLALLGAAAVVWIVDTVKRMTVSESARQAITVLLTLLAIVPPAYTSIQFNALESRVWTTEQAYRWIVRTLPGGTTVCIEGTVTFHLPAAYRSTHVIQLRRKGDAAGFQHEGIQYHEAYSQVNGPYIEHPDQFPAEYADYARLFAETKVVAQFAPTQDHPGPELRILRLQ